jgi:hypothetical protein
MSRPLNGEDAVRNKISVLIGFMAFLALPGQIIAQFTPEELSERPKWEEFLKTAEIIGQSKIPEGVTKPIKLTLKRGEMIGHGAWKKAKGMMNGSLEGWQYEIAAYELDKLLGLNMIPPTVEKEFNGEKGSLQYWMMFEMSDLERLEQGINIPKDKLLSWNKQKYLARAFDCLIANEDRTQQNIRYMEGFRTILIDHSRSFRCSKKFRKKLVLGKKGLLAQKLFRRLPRSFVEKVSSLNFSLIKDAVGPYLTDEEIEAVLDRKVLLLAEIDEMLRESGEAKILY